MPSAASVTNQTAVIGPNSAPTEPVPRFWIQNSATMISTVSGHDERVQHRGHHLEPLDRGEHRDRRRDHRVAEEHRGTEDAEPDQPPAQPPLAFGPAGDQRSEREDAALAVVVRTHDQHHVLERDDDDQRPEHERQQAVDVGLVERHAVRAAEDLAHRVQRRGADVAVDDADRADHQRQHAALAAGRGHVGLPHPVPVPLPPPLPPPLPSSLRREKRMLSCFSLR